MFQHYLDSAEKIWSGWEIRLLILLSLLLQIVLILFGNRRKYSSSTWVTGVIWAAYLLSDSVATFSLGIISTNSSSSSDKSIQAASKAVMVFWAPFLLVHLGGPDTITAYSLEDNELWLRHLLGLLAHAGVVLYLLVLSWIRNSINSDPYPLTFIAIPVLVSGVLKYGEKTWVLWSSSSERFKKTSYPVPVTSAIATPWAGYKEEALGRLEEEHNEDYSKMEKAVKINPLLTGVIPAAKLLVTAGWLFKTLKTFYANHIIYTFLVTDDLKPLSHESPEDAFKVVEIELGFMYDLLFSKASAAHSPVGWILRFISLVSSSAAFLAFCIVVDKHNFSPVDIIITYVLVAGAVCAEIYAIVMLIFSERTLLRLKKQQKGFGNLLYRFISACPSASMSRKRWLGSMAQYNLLDFCFEDKPAWCGRIQRLFGIYETLEIGRYKTWEKVTNDLKRMIVANIKERIGSIRETETLRRICSNRGEYAFQIRGLDSMDQYASGGKVFSHLYVSSIEVDHSILIWHIATDYCYYADLYRGQNSENPSPSLKGRISKLLSNYMLYLLVMRPSMLPKGNGGARYRNTCADVKRLIRETTDARSSPAQGWPSLIDVDDDLSIFALLKEQKAESVSVLVTGCLLAKTLRQMETNPWVRLRRIGERIEDKWDVIADVWIEMLCYVATKCDWKYHIQELSRGGEFLTHVCFLMVHNGLSDQFGALGDASRDILSALKNTGVLHEGMDSRISLRMNEGI